MRRNVCVLIFAFLFCSCNTIRSSNQIVLDKTNAIKNYSIGLNLRYNVYNDGEVSTSYAGSFLLKDGVCSVDFYSSNGEISLLDYYFDEYGLNARVMCTKFYHRKNDGKMYRQYFTPAVYLLSFSYNELDELMNREYGIYGNVYNITDKQIDYYNFNAVIIKKCSVYNNDEVVILNPGESINVIDVENTDSVEMKYKFVYNNIEYWFDAEYAKPYLYNTSYDYDLLAEAFGF